MGRYLDERCSDAKTWDQYSENVIKKKIPTKAVSEQSFALPSPYNRARNDILEADVLKATLATLKKNGCWHRRIEGGGVIHWSAGEGVMGASRMKGMADVLALINGKFVAMELKKPGGRIKGSQLSELKTIINGGGIGVILCLPDSCETLIKHLEKHVALFPDPILGVPVY